MWRDMEIVRILTYSFLLVICYGRFISMPRQARLSLAELMPYYFNNDIDGHPGTYSYGYDVKDPATGNNQFRTEERYPNGTVIGSYGYVDAWGRPQRYKYIADAKGYRVMRDPPYRPYREPVTTASYPSYPSPADSYPVEPLRPSQSYLSASGALRPSDSVDSSVTWTRPKRPNKRKKNNNYVNRPVYNFIGPPSSYSED